MLIAVKEADISMAQYDHMRAVADETIRVDRIVHFKMLFRGP